MSSTALKDVDFGGHNTRVGGPTATQHCINSLFTGQVLMFVLLQHIEVFLGLTDVLLEWEYLLILVVQAGNFFLGPLNTLAQLTCAMVVANQGKPSLPTVRRTVK